MNQSSLQQKLATAAEDTICFLFRAFDFVGTVVDAISLVSKLAQLIVQALGCLIHF
jgi:hypothetical protein